MKINRISNTIKTTALAGLLATSPLTTKAQVYTNGGERILARDTVELFKGKTAEALLIDNNGNYNTFENLRWVHWILNLPNIRI